MKRIDGRTYKPQVGDIVVIYFRDKDLFAHLILEQSWKCVILQGKYNVGRRFVHHYKNWQEEDGDVSFLIRSGEE